MNGVRIWNFILSRRCLCKFTKAKKPQEVKSVAFTKYFQNLTRFDKVLLISGSLAAIIAGIILPSISLVMGNIAIAFSSQ